MAETPPDGLEPDRGSPGMPRWVKVGIVVFVALVLLLVILTVAGLHEPQPGGHGPYAWGWGGPLVVTMSPGLRKFALAAHLTVSIGWVGAVAAYLALDVTAATSQDAQTLRAAYLAMEPIARFVIVPLAVTSLLTGLVKSLGTKWGLSRHYWVLISLVLTVVATAVLLVEIRTISSLGDIAADPSMSAQELRAMPSTLIHSVGGLVVLLIVLVLNTYKPQGLTRYGWRKLQAERAERGQLMP